MDMKAFIRNGLAVSGDVRAISRNADGVFTGRRTPVFSNTQNALAALYGDLAGNCYDAQMQGYDPADFYRFWPVKLRCEDRSREATGTNLSDDVKSIVVYWPEGVDYVPIGAHVTFAGNTWLVTNPANMSSILSDVIVRRCNLVYSTLDFYGNVVSCPFTRQKMDPRGAQDDYTKNMILADHYFVCAMQINDVSAGIRENTRMILGSAAYSVRGLNDFTRAFTDDGDSVHIMYFQLQREEKVGVYDDMERKIADGLAFSWDISLTANVSMNVGQEQTAVPVSVRNGICIASTPENPFSYLWGSSDTSVLEVGAEGEIKAVGEGAATVTCTLKENPAISGSVRIEVSEAAGGWVAFSGTPVSSIREQQSAAFTAAFYEDGAETDEPVAFTLSGPEAWCWSADIQGNTLTVSCWERSAEPLVIRAAHGDAEAVWHVALDAW